MAYIDIKILINLYSLTEEEDVLHEGRKLPAVADFMAGRGIQWRWGYHAAVDLIDASFAGRHLVRQG